MNTGALRSRLGLWGTLCYDCSKAPPLQNYKKGFRALGFGNWGAGCASLEEPVQGILVKVPKTDDSNKT